MKFQLFTPAPGLAPYIQFYGLLQSSENHPTEMRDLIPPYPCKGLIFSLGENPPVYISNEHFQVKASEGYLMPQCTHSWHIYIKGNFSLLGVFFRPGMFRFFLFFHQAVTLFTPIPKISCYFIHSINPQMI